MASYQVYCSAQSGSMVVEAALAEAGAEHERIMVGRGADGLLEPAFTAINPRRQVPALMLPDGEVITETAAMLLHVADAFPAAGLAPAPGTSARARHDRWLTFFHANIYEGILRSFYSERYVSDPSCAEQVRVAAEAYVQQHFALFEAALGAGPYLLGAGVSMVDLYAWMLTQWIEGDWLERDCPKVTRLCAAVADRPLVRVVQARHPA